MVSEEEKKEKGYERVFEEIGVENFPKKEKEIVNQVQEAQRVPYRINPKRNTPRHILIKLIKTKHKERILKAAREKQEVTSKGLQIILQSYSHQDSVVLAPKQKYRSMEQDRKQRNKPKHLWVPYF